MTDIAYPAATRGIGARRRELAPGIGEAFDEFSRRVFADGALPSTTEQRTAVAVAHATRWPYRIAGNTTRTHRAGASDHVIMEPIWVAAEMRAGAACAHSTIALHSLDKGTHE